MGPQRDRDMFSTFVAARSGSLLRTAYLLVGDHALAQDLVQEALVKTYQSWGRLRDPSNAEAYTRRVMVTTLVSWRRRRSFHERPQAVLRDVVVTDPSEGLMERDAIWRDLQALPPRQRAALVLRFYEDMSDAEVADVLGCQPATVRSQVSQGLGRLRIQARSASLPVPKGEATF
jgi:RNA polymerase sigma-70 factor (sigma-E family)